MSQTNQVATLMKTSNGDYLIHYGVPGMKWGVRKARKYAAKSNKFSRQESEVKKANNGKSNSESRELKRKADKYKDKAIKSASKANAKYIKRTKQEAKQLKKPGRRTANTPSWGNVIGYNVAGRVGATALGLGGLLLAGPAGATAGNILGRVAGTSAAYVVRRTASKYSKNIVKKERQTLLSEARKWSGMYKENSQILREFGAEESYKKKKK